MENKRYILLATLVGLSMLLGSMLSIPTPTTSGYGQAIGHGGVFEYQHIRNGKVIDEWGNPNTLMYSGGDGLMDLATGSASSAFDYIAIGNGTDPAAADTTLNAEITVDGLARAQGTISIDSSGNMNNVSIYKVFTHTGANSIVVNTSALFNASSAGAMFIGDDFTDRTMETDDQLNISAYFWPS